MNFFLDKFLVLLIDCLFLLATYDVTSSLISFKTSFEGINTPKDQLIKLFVDLFPDMDSRSFSHFS